MAAWYGAGLRRAMLMASTTMCMLCTCYRRTMIMASMPERKSTIMKELTIENQWICAGGPRTATLHVRRTRGASNSAMHATAHTQRTATAVRCGAVQCGVARLLVRGVEVDVPARGPLDVGVLPSHVVRPEDLSGHGDGLGRHVVRYRLGLGTRAQGGRRAVGAFERRHVPAAAKAAEVRRKCGDGRGGRGGNCGGGGRGGRASLSSPLPPPPPLLSFQGAIAWQRRTRA